MCRRRTSTDEWFWCRAEIKPAQWPLLHRRTDTFGYLYKYISEFVQIHFAILTNTFCNLDKYMNIWIILILSRDKTYSVTAASLQSSSPLQYIAVRYRYKYKYIEIYAQMQIPRKYIYKYRCLIWKMMSACQCLKFLFLQLSECKFNRYLHFCEVLFAQSFCYCTGKFRNKTRIRKVDENL